MEENQFQTQQQGNANNNGDYRAPGDYASPENESGFTQNNTGFYTNAAGADTAQSGPYYNANQNPYGNGYPTYNPYAAYGTAATPVDEKGNPLKNHFGLKLTFCILEILCCCLCSPLPFIIGIIALILVCIANDRYKKGMISEFKGMALASTILLWVGFAMIVLTILFWVFSFVGVYMEAENAVENGYYRDLEDYFDAYLNEEDAPMFDDRTLENQLFDIEDGYFEDYTYDHHGDIYQE